MSGILRIAMVVRQLGIRVFVGGVELPAEKQLRDATV